MKNIVRTLTILALFATLQHSAKAASGTATVPLSITVNGAVTVTDAATDTAAGKNPTLNVNLSVTPDIGASDVSGSANFRVRTNFTNWKLTAQRAGFTANGTGLAATNVGLSITKTAGSDASATACTLQAPFTGSTTINSISASAATDICAGTTTKTASAASTSANTNNYLNFATTYTVAQDFFFTPGSGAATDTITYTVANF